MWYPLFLNRSEQEHATTHPTSYPMQYPAQPVRGENGVTGENGVREVSRTRTAAGGFRRLCLCGLRALALRRFADVLNIRKVAGTS